MRFTTITRSVANSKKLTNRTDTSDQLINPSKRHALVGMRTDTPGSQQLDVVSAPGLARQPNQQGNRARVDANDPAAAQSLVLAAGKTALAAA